MSAPAQSYANHVRHDPWFHFIIVPIFVFALIWSVVHLILHPRIESAEWVLISIGALVLVFKARLYALKVQTRIIRLEERLRLHELLGDPVRARIPELNESQLAALRFASDDECPALVQQVLQDKLSNREIKKLIRVWRPDHWRV